MFGFGLDVGIATLGGSAAPTPTPTPGTPNVVYTMDETTAQQTWLGPMIEAQVSAFGAGNQLLNEAGGYLHDLTPSELSRLNSMLAALPGRPRFLRYAAGLFPQRGVTSDSKNLVEHYTTAGLAVAGATQVVTTVSQNAQLAAHLDASGFEGIDFEYWSPAPFWKANGTLSAGNTDAPAKSSDDPAVDPTYWNWINDFTDAVIVDLQYAATNTGKPISMFSLQNEPSSTATTYSHCSYIGKEQAYVDLLRVLIPKLLAATIAHTTSANIRIHADSWDGFGGTIGTIIRTGTRDCITLNMTPSSETKGAAGYNIIDKLWAWSVHKIDDYATNAESVANNEDTDLPAFNSEFEHFDSHRATHLAAQSPNGEGWMFCNLALVIVNTMRRWQAQTGCFPIHLFKPVYDNAENLGFALLEWKSPVTANITNNANATGDSAFDGLGVGEWTYNKRNWNALLGFYRHLPHDAVRHTHSAVASGATTTNQSYAAFKSGNQWIFCYINRTASTFTFKNSLAVDRDFLIHTYDINSNPAGPTPTLTEATAAGGLVVDVPAFSVVWAVQNSGDMITPTITSNNSASVAENATLSHALTASESVTWSLAGGADQARFEISGSTLRWASNGTKNYEAPDDANTDNAYVVIVRARDAANNSATQTITVTVTNVEETSYEAESETYFAAMSVAPDDTRKGHIDDLVAGLKADGVWSKLDHLLLLAAHDAQAARLNVKNPAQSATAVNSPTFTTDRGYTTNGTNSEIDTGFNTSTGTNFAQNSAYFGVYIRSADAASGNSSAGWFDGTDGVTLNVRDASNKLVGRANQATSMVSVSTVATTAGLSAVVRSASNSMGVRRNGASIDGAATASTALNNTTLRLGRSSSTGYRSHEFSASAAGGYLTTTEETALYNRLQTYLTAVGAI